MTKPPSDIYDGEPGLVYWEGKTISDDIARSMLERTIEAHGGLTAYALHLDVSIAFLSRMRNKNGTISGKVLKDLELERVYQYRLKRTKVDPRQLAYERRRSIVSAIVREQVRAQLEQAAKEAPHIVPDRSSGT